MILRRKLEPSEISGWLVFGQFCCCQGMADPVPIVRTFMSSPEVTCSWTCLKAFKFGCSLEICWGSSQGRIATWCSGGSWFRKKCNKNPNFIRINSSGHHNDRLQEFTWTIGRHHRGGQGVFAAQWCRPPHLGVAAIGAVGALSTGQWSLPASCLCWQGALQFVQNRKSMIRHINGGTSCWTWQIILNKLDLVSTEDAIKVKDLGYAVRMLAIGRQGCEWTEWTCMILSHSILCRIELERLISMPKSCLLLKEGSRWGGLLHDFQSCSTF